MERVTFCSLFEAGGAGRATTQKPTVNAVQVQTVLSRKEADEGEAGFTNPVPRFRRRKGSGKNPDGQGTSQTVGADEFFRLRAAKVIELFTKLC